MKKYLVYSVLAVFFACTNDDGGQDSETQEITLSNFSIVSFDDDAFFEYRFNEATQTGETTNLTEEEGISRLAFFTRRNDGVFGFFGPGSAAIKDFETEQLNFVQDLGGNPGEERVNSAHDASSIGLIFTMQGTPDFFLRIFDAASSAGTIVALGEVSEDVQLYIQGDTFFVIDIEDGASRIIKIDKASSIITNDVTINHIVQGLVFGEAQDIFVFDNSGNYQQLDINDLSLLSENSSLYVPNIDVTAKIRDGVIYSQFEYPQPNFFAIGPAAYELSEGNRNIIDVALIFDNYLLENPDTESIQPVHFDFDTENEVWVVAFAAVNTDNSNRFGYFVINQAQEILIERSLERLPWTVVLYN